jgi:nucleoside-diphosphate-sugar epimerase
MQKLKAIQGDVTFDGKLKSILLHFISLLHYNYNNYKFSKGLGISHDQGQLLLNETNIVFHCAATLRLEAKLKDAIDMNTTGTRRLLDFCKNMKQLNAFLHLSTAFCNCDQVRNNFVNFVRC